uniref:Uncharacterized protein n=1 Tax=Chromera velia CCMP2878 TaxID=1169474 RepID=A0A0G4HPS7_9ALVE|eukprot:Cvel_30056.t1-p1 / transcript=Cvel_30056.t1 / gene=Cvel_30056 / organism=Chromera_velia_CCMP2878 / gene_product=hypothetical protein / transcript_product=hypothetical protein / location=Cvel_scaffold4227:1620-5864(-) / protein_length=499 / sequence_SO=supercontig / SO=protein_coding / is_pseudo=false
MVLPDNSLGVLFLCISIFQFFAGVYLFHVSAQFIGSQQILRLRWEKGYNNDVVGARNLPLNRFVGAIISFISFVEYAIRSCQSLDKAAGRDPGLDVTQYMYWGYLVGCPLIIWDFTETLGMEGIPFYSAATFFCLFVGFWTEHIRSSAQWFLFGTGIVLVGVMAWNVSKRALYVLRILMKHDVSKNSARWLLIAMMTFGLGWCVFPIAWLLRNDIHNVGTVHPSYIALLHAFGDVVSKPLFAIFLTRYRQCTEDMHLKSILRALNWLRDFEDKKTDFEFKEVPEEVVIVTVPALLESCLAQKKPEEVKRALDVVRHRSMTGKAGKDVALLVTQLGPTGGGGLMVPDVEGQPPEKVPSATALHQAPAHFSHPQMIPQSGAVWPTPYPYGPSFGHAYPYPHGGGMVPQAEYPAPAGAPASSPNGGHVDDPMLENVLEAIGSLGRTLDNLGTHSGRQQPPPAAGKEKEKEREREAPGRLGGSKRDPNRSPSVCFPAGTVFDD